MLRCEKFYNVLASKGFNYFTGVPDSTFKSWMSFLDDNSNSSNLTHRIAAIERDAIAWAAGYNVATGKVGVVYMQNSGLGNTINPITSLTDPEVYKIPLLLMIGWRGEPGKKDEPQHIKMGKITLEQLDVLGIKYDFLPAEIEAAEKVITEARSYIDQTGEPFALVIRKGLFEPYQSKKSNQQQYEMKREDSIKLVINQLKSKDIVVSTTGKASREVFEHREVRGESHEKDFLMVGSMGCASSFAAEIALQKPDRSVYIFDGDGAVIMSEGSLSTIGHYSPKNLFHIVFDNDSYESTGGQPTTASTVNFEQLALANGYKHTRSVETNENLITTFQEMDSLKGPKMLIVKVAKGARKELGRPTTTPIQNKKAFRGFLDSESTE
jgi:phosphonopyruvate decarboxylase